MMRFPLVQMPNIGRLACYLFCYLFKVSQSWVFERGQEEPSQNFFRPLKHSLPTPSGPLSHAGRPISNHCREGSISPSSVNTGLLLCCRRPEEVKWI